MKRNLKSIVFLFLGIVTVSCSNDNENKTAVSKDINTAEKVSVDRFSEGVGHLMVRTATNGLPAANAAVDFDKEPFITMGLDANGNSVKYYNFDVQPLAPKPIYVFFKSGEETPVSGQNNIIDVIPGDSGYTDFWLVQKVTVPKDYVPNSITSASEVLSSGYQITNTGNIVNCPVVPFGSIAAKSNVAGKASEITLGWYKDKAVAYFSFVEAPLSVTPSGNVPVSPIYVIFNVNPDSNNANSGPASGFKTEAGTQQTHNVIATIPGDTGYSPLWNVFVVDNKYFDNVNNLSSATTTSPTAAGANVNCPVVK